MAAIQGFVNQRAVFVSDTSLWRDPGVGSDRPIIFGDNQLLRENIVTYISVGGGLLVAADNGHGFDVGNLNALVSPWGISYASSPTSIAGRTITGFVNHAVTNGLNSIGVDFHLPITTNNPSLDLTTGSGNDDALSVLIPEPRTLSLLCLAAIGLIRGVPRRRRSRLGTDQMP